MNEQRVKEQVVECDQSSPVVCALERILGLVAAAVMAYYYYSKGYIDLLRQIGGALFG